MLVENLRVAKSRPERAKRIRKAVFQFGSEDFTDFFGEIDISRECLDRISIGVALYDLGQLERDVRSTEKQVVGVLDLVREIDI